MASKPRVHLINNIHPNDDGELSVEQSQQMDRYSRHGSRFKRDFERTLKQLTEHQKERKGDEFVDLRQAGQIHDLHIMLGEEWDAPQYGFDLTIPQIVKYMRRRNVILDATAMYVNYVKKDYLKEMAKNVF